MVHHFRGYRITKCQSIFAIRLPSLSYVLTDTPTIFKIEFYLFFHYNNESCCLLVKKKWNHFFRSLFSGMVAHYNGGCGCYAYKNCSSDRLIGEQNGICHICHLVTGWWSKSPGNESITFLLKPTSTFLHHRLWANPSKETTEQSDR